MAIERWRPGFDLMRGPFRELRRLEREMENLFGKFVREWPFPRGIGEAPGFAAAVDMADRKEEILLRADLPGLTQKDVEVTVTDGVLYIRGERKEEREAKEEDYYCCERWAGRFERSIALPAGVDADHVRASFKNEILEVHLPKVERAKEKAIPVMIE